MTDFPKRLVFQIENQQLIRCYLVGGKVTYTERFTKS